MNEKKYFLCSLINNYLDFSENIKGLSKNTTKSYQRDLTKFSKFLEASGINQLEGIKEEKHGSQTFFKKMLVRDPFKDIYLLPRVFLII